MKTYEIRHAPSRNLPGLFTVAVVRTDEQRERAVLTIYGIRNAVIADQIARDYAFTYQAPIVTPMQVAA